MKYLTNDNVEIDYHDQGLGQSVVFNRRFWWLSRNLEGVKLIFERNELSSHYIRSS
jgi:hypothetical protein